MNFYEYFDSLPKSEKIQFRNKITNETGKSQQTFYWWLRQKRITGILVRKKIAEILQKEINVLFPNQDNN